MMHKNWSFLPFSNAFKQISILSKIKLKEYKTEGKFPIIDQGENFISGYWNNDYDVINEIPLIAFGDHTRRFKFISFPFVAGADGLKLFSPLFTTPRFSYYMCLALSFPNKGYARHSPFLKNCIFPVPPLAEQGRIVQKIEELFADIDAGIQNLKSVQDQIKLYRQSVLKSAFDNDFEVMALKNHIIEMNYGTSDKTNDDKSGIPVLRMGDIQNGKLYFNNLKYLNEIKDEKLILKKGDLLFNRTNSAELVGKSAVFKANFRCSFASYLIKVRFDDFLDSDYVCFFINSPYGRLWAKSQLTQQVGQANINGKKLQELQIPVPTLDEQKRIVAEIERRFERADELEKAVNAALADAEKLKQSVLKKAFRGELVEQNPDDEPAAVLLSRIRAERATAPKSPKKGKRK